MKFNVLHVQKPKGTSCIQHLGEYKSEKELSNYLIGEFVMREMLKCPLYRGYLVLVPRPFMLTWRWLIGSMNFVTLKC